MKTIKLEQLLEGIERVDLVKFDCEGSELDVLRNASDAVLAKLGLILGEFHDEQGSSSFEKLLRSRFPERHIEVQPGKAIGMFWCWPRQG